MRPWRGWLVLLGIVPVVWGGPQAAAAREGRNPLDLALVMGVNQHLREPAYVFQYADDSALLAVTTIQMVMPSAEIRVLASVDDPDTAAGFEAAGVTPQPPTGAGFDHLIQTLSQAAYQARAASRPVRLFIYFAGFADPGGVFHLADRSLEMEALLSAVEQVRPDAAFALFDAAFPTRVAPGTRAPLVPPPVIPSAAELGYRPSNLGYLGATTSVVQLNNSRGGLLSSVALTGLAGAADLDGDQRVSFFEWRQFVRMQIDLNKPFAPSVRAVAPTRDPLATVVDLSGVLSSRLVVADTVPGGIMEVRAPGGRIVAQWYHHQGFADRVCVPSGRLQVDRYSDRTPRKVHGADGQVLYVSNRIYPVERALIAVGSGEVVGYDLNTETTQLFLIPEDRGDGGAFPEGSEVVPLSAEEEVRLIGLLFRNVRTREQQLPVPGWYLSARAAVPAALEVDFSSGLEVHGPDPALPLVSGGSFRIARTVPRALFDRWYRSRCFLFEYGQYAVRNVDARDLDGNTYHHDSARSHQFRFGPGLRQTHVGAAVRWDFEQSLTYGPLWVVDETGAGGLHILSLSELLIETSAAMMVRLGAALEVGPVVGVQLGLFHEGSPTRLLIQPQVGLVLRPQVVRE